MNKAPQEIKFGDGGYVMHDGDILPLDGELEEVTSEREPRYLGEDSSQQERLAYIYDNYRFYPKSPEELSALVGIDGARNSDAGKYLSIIMQHQENLDVRTVDPTVTERTARKLAADFIKYRDDSRAVATFLRDVLDEIGDTDDSTDAASFYRDYTGGPRRALAQVLRREEIADFTNGYETEEKFTFLNDSGYIDMLDDYTDSSSIADFRDMTEDTLEEERRRHVYWQEKLKELKRVTVVSAMAMRALGEI